MKMKMEKGFNMNMFSAVSYRYLKVFQVSGKLMTSTSDNERYKFNTLRAIITSYSPSSLELLEVFTILAEGALYCQIRT